MKISKQLLIVFVLLMVVLPACQGNTQPATATPEFDQEIPLEAVTPTPRPAPTEAEEETIVPSSQSYLSASETFQINLPDGWNCSESGDYQVNCESGDGDAIMQARITSTGYALTDEDLLAFSHAELVHRYGAVKEYTEINRSENPGKITNRASWRQNEDYWGSTDTFTRQGRSVFHLTLASKITTAERYTNTFIEIADSVKVYSEKITGAALYPFRKSVSARDAFFEIEVPTSWGRFIDTTSVEKTIVEGYLSPDKRASVQIAIYKQGTFIEQDAKAFNTREIMFDLYGYDLKNSDDRALPDGRERLTWYAAGKDIYGVTDFDTYVNALYLFTIVWEPETEELYLPVLKQIQASFIRE